MVSSVAIPPVVVLLLHLSSLVVLTRVQQKVHTDNVMSSTGGIHSCHGQSGRQCSVLRRERESRVSVRSWVYGLAVNV